MSVRRAGRARFALLIAGVGLLVAAWVAATQPFGAPDEASHYLRALSITNGHILGHKAVYTGFPLPPVQEAWASRDNRTVLVPARLTPPNVHCVNGKPDVSGQCLEQTVSGNYPPFAFLLPAAALAVSHRTSTAIWLTRAASALPSLAFLLLAVALLWDGTGWSLLGFFAATSPMVFWSSSILNPSGMQITACLALAAALIRISRAPAEAPGWAWLALAVSGFAGILAGPIGLEFVLLELVVFAALVGRPVLRELRDTTRPSVLWGCALVLAAAALAALIYQRVAGFSATVHISLGLHGGLTQVSPVLRGAVGIFGALTVFLPLAAYWIWWLLVLALVMVAIWVGDRRDRVVTVGVAVVALAFPVLFYAWFDRFTGFGLQGREVLPPLMLIPLVAGEVIFRRGAAIRRRRLAQAVLGGMIALIAVFQAYAWWFDARTVAGAPHTIRFYAHATWSPPLGWGPWIGFAVAGTVALLIFAASEAFSQPLLVKAEPRVETAARDPLRPGLVARD